MTPTERRLEILAVLQTRPGITAPALAERLAVSERTARRDVEHLRRIGYGIEGESGRYGGYVLAGGTRLPPLLLDADEAAAVALGLTGDLGVSGLELAAGTALAKLTEAAPARARGDADRGGNGRRGRPARLPHGVVAGAAGSRPRLPARVRRYDCAGTGGTGPRSSDRSSSRTAWFGSGLTGISWPGRRTDRRGARTRWSGSPGSSGPAPGWPPPLPRRTRRAFVRDSLATGPRRYRVEVRLHTSAELARDLVNPTTGTVADEGPSCVLTLATDDLDWAARYLVYLNVDFDVLAPAELTGALHNLGDWLSRRHPA